MTQDGQRKASERRFHDERYADDTRARQDKYYAVFGASQRDFRRAVREATRGADVLEYGCGATPHALEVAQEAASVTGIDLSEVAIDHARSAARETLRHARFTVMDAEALDFDDNSFDVVFGSAIVHHLDVERSLREIVRVLRPGGKAVFAEPMGHNPAINLYRRMTPTARTPDEHPLRFEDLNLAASYFGQSDFRFYHFLSLAAVPLRSRRIFEPLLQNLDAADSRLFRSVPPSRRLAWYVVMALGDPIKEAQSSRLGPSADK